MDPTQCLKDILELIALYPTVLPEFEHLVREDVVERLENLIAWLRGGGFFPSYTEES